MRADEIIRDIKKGQEAGQAFIKWWRIENDFTDYELFDSFIENARSSHEIAGFELLDLEQMWDVLTRWKPTGLKRVRTGTGEMIEWLKKTDDATLELEVCPFTPESVMQIFDYETHGDVVG